MQGRFWRVWAFIALCAAAAALAGGYAARALRPAGSGVDAPATRATPPGLPERLGGVPPGLPERLSGVPPGLPERLSGVPPSAPYLLVRSTAPDASFRRLVAVPLASASEPGYVSPLECERAYFAAGRGVCLAAETRGLVSAHLAHIFDDGFTPLHTLELTGLPSRARISPDGRRAAITVFERGHSYAEDGFSTRTSIVDTQTGRVLGDLEQFTIVRDGNRFAAVDFNFWGLTFQRDGNRFYATLGTGGQNYLIEGDIDAKTGRVLRAGIECPSLSPDNTRLVYKSRIAPGVWRLRLLDLRSGADTPLNRESRSVDDQVDWLDDERVLYHVTGARGADIWSLRVDETEAPVLLRPYSYSPSVVR
jgi:hypothetical protein